LFRRDRLAISADLFGLTGVNGVRRMTGLAGVLAAAMALAGCNTSGGMFGSGATPQPAGAQTTPAVGSPVHTALFGQPVTPQVADVDPRLCPRIEVRDGSNLWRQGGEGPTELRYQATVTDLARECRIDGSTMTIRVGIEGRVLVGPKGDAGRVTLPIRIAVTRGLSQPVWTRLYQVPIEIPAGSPNVTFTQVEDAVQFPLPEPAELATYIVFVGFDTLAQQPERPRRGRGRTAQR
jgi:hypothetical protein